ncbi:MAG: hypothetical protein HPY50_13585 [Firmicutes bacterium]|nr:hypothetical protein [Bacillota bacterium]
MGFWSSLFYKKNKTIEIQQKLCHENVLIPLSGAEAARLLVDQNWRKKGMLFMARKQSGECWYLTPEGCSIWNHRPQACRIRKMRDLDDLEQG